MEDYQNRRLFIRKAVPVAAYQTYQKVTFVGPQGVVTANPGDWIITENNQRRALTNEEFTATYERLETQQ